MTLDAQGRIYVVGAVSGNLLRFTPSPGGKRCGLGFEVVPLLLAYLGFRRRRGSHRPDLLG